MIYILVTGANGQLGKCLQDAAKNYPNTQFIFTDLEELDITQEYLVDKFFAEHKFDYCVNCAAYTAVDKAEIDKEGAYLANAESVKYLALACKREQTTLIQVSTDFVFDGTKVTPYTEKDIPSPMNVYGASKLKGEEYLREIMDNYFIIRTSWVYSEYGNNFVKTMLQLVKDRNELSIVNDQIGSPTYAVDLATFILFIVHLKSSDYGVYHFSNEGEISWFEFAKAIFEESDIHIKLNPVNSEEYPAPAERPKYSVLNKAKTSKTFNLTITNWRESLVECLKRL